MADSTIFSHTSTMYTDFLSLYVCTFAYSLPLYHGGSLLHILLWWLCQLSIWLLSASTSVVLMYSTRSGFSLSIHKQCFQGQLTTTDAMPCTASASHAHALGPPQGPTYLPLGHTPSILVNTNNDRDAHDAWGFVLPHILHCYLLISDLVRGISHGIFSAMPH